MTAHGLSEKEWRRAHAGRRSASPVVHLGWPHFWLLSGILAGILALVAMMFLASRIAV